MEVSIQENSTLERRMTVTIPAEEVTQVLTNYLRDMAKTAKIPGFRPGKAPLSVVESRHRDEIYSKVTDQLVNATYRKALEDHSLLPAGEAEIEPEPIERDKEFSYTATFEVYPEIDPQGYSGIELTQYTAEVTKKSIDQAIERMRWARATFEPVDRPARYGDQVVIDSSGTIDGEPFEGAEAESYTFELGAKSYLQELDEGLVGVRAGDSRVVPLPLPEDYPDSEVAGRTVEFRITVQEVRERRLPEEDEKLLNPESEDSEVQSLRAEIQKGLEQEVTDRAQELLRAQVFDRLAEANPIDLPNQLVEFQIERMIESNKELCRNQGIDPDNLDLDSEQAREGFREGARKQAIVGLIIPEIARKEGIQESDEEVRNELHRMAESYGEQKDDFLQWVTQEGQQQQQIQQIRGRARVRALEKKVVDWVIEHAQITEKADTVSHLLGWGVDEPQGNPESKGST